MLELPFETGAYEGSPLEATRVLRVSTCRSKPAIGLVRNHRARALQIQPQSGQGTMVSIRRLAARESTKACSSMTHGIAGAKAEIFASGTDVHLQAKVSKCPPSLLGNWSVVRSNLGHQFRGFLDFGASCWEFHQMWGDFP